MISIDLKDNSVLISLDGKYSKVMTEIFIALVKLTGDNPGTLINNLMGSYYKIGGKQNDLY